MLKDKTKLIKTVKIALYFVLAILLLGYLFPPQVSTPVQSSGKKYDGNKLFGKDLQKRLKAGQLVVVDKNGSDHLIQEDLSTSDLPKAITFARYKSEVLEQPLYIESAKTYDNSKEHVAVVDPTDRRAWQELILDEIHLKDQYEKQHPKDLRGYQEQKSMDAQKTPEAMVAIIEKYPDSSLNANALANIEYALCVARKAPEKAIKIYDDLAAKFPDKENLQYMLKVYRGRAQKYVEQSEQKA